MPRKRRPARWEEPADWYPPSQPLPVKDGIKATTARGAFGTSWWAKRWIAVLEQFGWGTRLQRGRSYARKGQVISIAIQAGRVAARVQGSAATPYQVTLTIPLLTEQQWAEATQAMAQHAQFAAQLLAGEMPQEIETAFVNAKVALFPQAARDLVTRCSCPDMANPCKHIAAVYYLLGEQFDGDPFLLFVLRGRTQEQLLAGLRTLRSAPPVAGGALPNAAEPLDRPLDALLDAFYTAGPALDTIQPAVAWPRMEAPILASCGPPPGVAEADLRRLYRQVTAAVLDEEVPGDAVPAPRMRPRRTRRL